jgi:hypothetical protein
MTSLTGYRIVEGEIENLVVRTHVLDFSVDGHRISVENSALTITLRDGERLRALVQEPIEDAFFHLVAFQREACEHVHHTGPTLTRHTSLIAAALLTAGLCAGMISPLLLATSLILLQWIFLAQQTEALGYFAAARPHSDQ